MKTITVKANNQVGTVAEHTVITQNNIPTVIQATDKTNYEIFDVAAGRAPNNIVTKRVSKDLHVSFENNSQNPDLIIEGFYDIDSALVGAAGNGNYYYYLPDTGDVTDYVTEMQVDEVQSHSLGGNAYSSPWWIGATDAEGFAALPWLLGLAGAGVAAAALGGGSSNNNDDDSSEADTTAPDAPSIDAFDGTAVTGNAEPGSRVDILDADDNVIGTITADATTGAYEVTLDTPLANGETINAIATDAAGNTSVESDPINAPDTTAPDAPSIDAFDGTTVTGSGEPGSRVDILDADDNVIGTAIADATTGVYEVTLDTPLANGETINAIATDAAGNTSVESDPVNAPDTTAPDAPSINIGNGDALITADEISDNQVTVSIGLPDNASVGDTVTVNGIDQLITDDDIANDMATVTIDAPLEGQSLQVTASITDVAGNESTAVTVNATRDTDDAPEAPDGVAIGNGDAFITADEIEGNQVDVIVDLPDSSSVGYTVIVNGVEKVLTNDDIEAGNVEVEIPAPEEGAALEVSVRIEDTAGNISPAVTANAIRDTTAPDTPLAAPVITDNVDGNGDLLDPAETIPDDGITNDNTPGVVIPDGELANGTPTLLVDGEAVPATLVGNTLTPNTPLADDTYDISYTITDAAGNVSAASPATTITVDTVAPGGEADAAIAAPVVVIDDEADDGVNAAEFADGVQTQVTLPSGTVAGDTVTLTVTPDGGDPITVEYEVTEDDLDANLGNGIVDVTIANDADDGITADGEYSVTATVTDAAGNVSAPSNAVSFTVDTTAPDTPLAAPVITDNVDGNGDLLDPAETIPDDGITNDNTPGVVIPDGELANGTPTLLVDGEAVPATLVGNTLTPNTPLADDTYDISYTITDAAGNVSAASPATTITVDTVAPGGEADAAIAAPVVVIDDEADDGVNAAEFADGVQTQVTLPSGTVAGDTVTLTVTPDGGDPITVEYEVTEDDLDANGGNGIADVTIANDADDGITADGEYSVTATVTDAAGNVSAPSNAVSFTVDTTAPDTPLAAPVITDNVDGNGDLLDPAETIPDDGITNDNTPGVVIPDGELANGTPTLLVDGEAVPATLVGNTLTPNTPLADDTYDISYTITDAAGNVSAASPATTITVDTVAPGGEADAAIAAPVVVIDDEADDGVNAAEFADGVQTQVTLPSGTVAGDTVTLTVTPDGGDPITVEYEVTEDDLDANLGNGIVDVTIANDADDGITADGEYSVTATVTDAAGNVSAPSNAVSFTVDTTAPDTPLAAPVITDNVDGNGDLLDPAETIPDDGITNDNTPGVVIPDGELANGTPTLLVDGEAVPATLVGNTLTPNTPLADDTYDISYTITDAAGNVSAASPATTITVDTVAPGGEADAAIAAPVVVIDDEADDGVNAAEFADGVQTQVTLPSGTVAGDTVTLTVTPDGGDPITVEYEVTEDDLDANLGNGIVDVTIANDADDGITADGEYSVTATVTDAAGNVSAPSDAVSFTVDTVAPGGEADAAIAAPVVVIDDEADDGVNAAEFADGVQTQVTLPSGTVAGDTVTLTVTPDGGDPITVEYEVTEDDLDANLGNGIVDVTIANDADDGITADGEYSVTATVTDAAGNVSAPSNAVSFTVDTTAPDTPLAAPVITDNVDGNGDLLDPAETIPDDGITNDNTPGVVIPDGELANGTPTLLVDGEAVPATLVGNTLTPNTPLADDTYDISYTITDAAGNVSAASPATTITVDTVAPGGEADAAIAAPVVVIDDEADDGVNAAEFADGVQTQVTLPSGTVAGDTVTLTVTPDGGDPITVEYEVTEDDLDANLGNGIVDVTIANDADDGITADGEYSVTATVTDAAGNVSAPSNAVSFTVDTTAPDTPLAAPVITDNVDGNGDLLDPAETIPDDGITNDNTPGVVIPDGELANGTPTLLVDGEAVPATLVGNTLTPNTPLADDTYDISYTITDAAGNVSAASPATTITVDTVAPGGEADAAIAAPVVVIDDEADDGVNAAEFADGVQTQVTLPSGTVAGDTVTLTVTPDGGDPITVEYEVTEDDLDANGGNGIADVTIANDADDGITADGEYSVTATVTDAAGNVSAPSNAVSFTVDTTAPDTPLAAPVITDNVDGNGDLLDPAETIPDDGITNDNTPGVVIPDGELANGTPTLLVDGEAVPATLVGNTLTPNTPLADDTYDISYTITDAAGNVSAASPATTITVDTVAPGGEADAAIAAPVVVIDDEADDGVNAAEFADGVQTQVTLPSGTVAGDTVTLTVTPDGGDPITVEYEVTEDDLDANLGNGIVDVTIANDADDGITADGEYSVTATVTDAAGNVSAPSNAVSFTVDTTAPGQPTVIIGNGDDLVNGFDLNDDGLVEVTVILPDNAEVDDIVTVDGMATLITQDMLDNGYNFAVAVPSQGVVLTVTANVTDQAGNTGSTGTDSATVGDTTAPAVLIPEALDGVNAEEFADGIQTQVTLPTGTVAGDTVTLTVTPDAGNPITVEYEVTAADLDVNDGDGIAEITIPNGIDGISDNGTYTVVATVTDANENVSAPSAAVEFDLNTTFTARDDLDDLDLGALQVTYYDPISESDLDVLGAAEGTGGADSSLGFTVSAGTNGTVSIEVSQTALVTVADAINIEVYNSNNELVYVGTTGSEPLVGNVIGIELLGLTGNDTLTATVSGLEPDNYTIVVRNDESALGALVNGLTLAELGEAGVVLGPDNQEVVFTTIDNALGPVLGGTVNGLLNIALTAAGDEGLGLDAVVDILEDNVLGLGVLDPLLDDITAVLLSNTLTLLETTDITATVTEFDYADDTVITGNVIDPDTSSLGEAGEDTVTVDTVLTDIDSNDTQSQPATEVVNGITVFTIQGQYGVLVIDETGDYTYTANGDFASNGQSETFTYTVSDGVISDTAELVISLDAIVDTTPPDAPTIDEPIAGDNIVNGTEAAASFAVTGTGVSGDTITLTDGSNNILGTAIVNAAGDWSINVDEAEVRAMGEGAEQLSATATDPAGNTGTDATATITVDTTVPIAFDNEVTLDIGFESSTTNAPLQSTEVGGLLNIGVLADTINVDLLSVDNALSFTVADNTTRQVTVDGSGSATLSLGGLFDLLALGDNDFDLLVYRVEEDSSEATLTFTQENWLQGSGVLPARWSADDLVLPEFQDGGTYYVTLGNSSGLLDASLLSSLTIRTTSDVITNYTPPDTVSAFIGGNVITDIGSDGADTITSGTVVSLVDGLPVEVDGSAIDGIYGTLTINPDGSYNYVADATFTGTYGDVDSFEYTITAENGESSTANLDITLDYSTNSGTFAARSISLDESFTLAIDDTIELPDTLLTTSSEGIDTLSFEGSGQIISLSDMMQPDIIDISGIGANTLNIADKDVDATIYVKGDNDDTVNLEGDSWTNTGQTTSEGEMYNVWQSSNDTQVHIDTDIVNII